MPPEVEAMVWVGGLGRLVVWISQDSPKMKGSKLLGASPRIPNHRAPKHQLTIS